MNRHQKAGLAVAAAAALSLSLTSAAYAATEEKPSYASSTIVVSDVRTGEIVYQQTEQIPVEEGSTTATIETRVPSPPVPSAPVIPGVVAPRSSVGGNHDNGSVKSSITITYSLNSKGDQIRTEKVTGRWTPDPGFALQGRKVEIYSGGGSPSIIKKAPTTNTYSYNTGWGFQTKPPQNSLTSPRVLAEVKFKLSGTGSAWLKLTHWVDLSGV
ncbi:MULTISPECIES: hypothetical protein [Microbacterium]|uniref:hypothetical protein n=1 Tax=Microbacterium TaxID=33882 RepID=UPI0021A595C5|nr:MULTISPECIES: hypothetical protein [Microbacterium]MCT1363232.1 hypothetical protein [Microbacterium sp. p3-SID131]MCZ0709606.1 hypothetical protein [Microbacterium paraoxydans]MDH5133427.1 hypothetical protein [Microbacterium sp. RD10]MDH5137183.1 hypothetical protein [Microbacterium sp. RD11]MDH5144528.1 hypothetical protein [Microbacterium sp. RD12]